MRSYYCASVVNDNTDETIFGDSIMYQSKETKRAKWLGEFETKVCKQRPEFNGKIDWNSAIYLYNSGNSVDSAVEKYLDTRSGDKIQ